jgi:hypothetical protein
MKLSVILISFLVAFSFLNQSFAEVYTTGSAADNNGNITVIGYCLGNVAVGGEQFNITTPSAFILKLNSDGEKIWVKFINSTQSIKANAIAVDSSGNIYITGEFSGTASFGSNILLAQNTDAFIVKLNIDGEVEWVKQGISTNTATGNDIYVSSDGFIFVCGVGSPILFDTFSVSGGGFTVKISYFGTVLALYSTLDKAYRITVDNELNFIICGGKWSPGYNYYTPRIGKFNNVGSLIWDYNGPYLSNIGTKYFCVTDSTTSIYTALEYFNQGATTIFSKLDPNGVTINYSYFIKLGVSDFSIKNENEFISTGYHFNNIQFGDSVLYSNGGKDAYITKLDSAFNPIWIKHGGGLYDDEISSISNLLDGSIRTTGNFKGTIDFDTLHVSGGTGSDDMWAALTKFDENGNIIWFKKIAENFITPSITNWFPLEKGNKLQFIGKKHYSSPSYLTERFLHNITVVDSSIVNNKKYYLLTGFFGFSSGTKFRFDEESQKIYALISNIEYTFMDFSKSSGESFQQIQPDGSLYPVNVITSNYPVLYDTLLVKGFYKSKGGINGWYYFAPDIGLVFQDEQVVSQFTSEIDLSIIEYYMNYPFPNIVHVKHKNAPDIQFEFVTLIPDTNRIIQLFEIIHQYSFKTEPPYLNGFSYIKNAYLQSFYYKGTDTIWNNNFNIPQTTEIDFSLDYQFDTTKYNQGYYLYYRIAVVDKGIVADTFYSPQTGYYKLFWKDSTTSVTQTEFEALTYSLSQNYPNPFNPVSKIVFTIPKRENVTLKVYDILGSEITTLVNKELDTGKYEVEFSGKELSSGIYIYQIKAGAFRETKKMILMR